MSDRSVPPRTATGSPGELSMEPPRTSEEATAGTGVESADSDRPVRIRATGIEKAYTGQDGDVQALSGMDLSVYDSEFFCLLGPSGCGKSTFLRLVSGLLEPDAGEIDIRTESNGDRPSTSMVFQEKGIFPWKSVLDNVAFGLKMRGVGRQNRYEIAREYIEKVNLSEFENAYPHQLSGGMAQRVGIARAFANDPQVLLMDEPFGDLDAQTKRYLQEELLSLWSESRKTVVYVTHDIEEAIQLGDRLGVMGARPGHLKEVIDVDLDRPRTRENLDIARLEELQTRVWDVLSDEVQRTVERR
ncbi:ABC-type nitrate/sulfonate/bicarbonate transportsystem, ATPase component [Halapricum desulfuricans]|uniref:ABC-type nitrate/sulfonate/bicarbonate transportsystem, ATPase component n=2 Tax=Halapricum desulfuricans TaxID=2841257 RepID=A0A897N8Q8_9EURY|nr:ABC-type nitrate/sulfonate/bicarbonate transportsystem, ATPase component [Halapricum desulfuricans]